MGQLGSALVHLDAWPVMANITHRDSLRVLLRGYKAVINCAAYTDVDGAESNPLRAFAVNAAGPLLLCQSYPGRIIHLSTDYVFDGRLGPYFETDKPCPLGVYGLSKYAGELAVSLRPDTLIVRTTILFRAGFPNFVTKALAALEKKGRVKATTALRGTPTYVPYLAKQLMRLAEMPDVSGILHVAGKRQLSRYDFAIEIARRWGYADGSVIATDETSGIASRPAYAGLMSNDTAKLGVVSHDPFDGLEEMRDADRH
jgi:dTDP-4-dehydrorhamnose reductase